MSAFGCSKQCNSVMRLGESFSELQSSALKWKSSKGKLVRESCRIRLHKPIKTKNNREGFTQYKLN